MPAYASDFEMAQNSNHFDHVFFAERAHFFKNQIEIEVIRVIGKCSWKEREVGKL